MAKRKPKPDPHDDIDHKIRVNEMKEELREVVGKEPTTLMSPDCPPEIEEKFYEQMLEYEKASCVTDKDRLARDGFTLPEGVKLSDAQLSAKLTELIQRLGRARTFLYHTNHLSDRELYEWLREHGLCEERPDMPGHPSFSWHMDVLGSYGEEEINLLNKYYATEEERQKHLKEWPDWPLPPHEDPRYDRDKTLPKCEY